MKYTKHVLVGFFVLASLADLITAVTAQNAFRETNPIYVAMGSWWLLVILKLLFTGLVIYIAFPKKGFPSERTYYLLLLVLVFGGLTYSLATYTNLEVGHINAEYYSQQAIPTTEEKTIHYNTFALTYYLLPLFIAFIPFLLFESSAPHQKFKKRRLIKK